MTETIAKRGSTASRVGERDLRRRGVHGPARRRDRLAGAPRAPTRRPAARAPAAAASDRRAAARGASRERAPPAREERDRAEHERRPPPSDERDDRERRRCRRRRASSWPRSSAPACRRTRARPSRRSSRRSRSAGRRRCRSWRRAGLREELEDASPLRSARLPPRPGHLLDHGVLAGAGLLHLPLPAGRRARTSRSRSPTAAVSSIFVVVASSFSVGTASVKSCSVFATRDRRAELARARTPEAATSGAPSTAAAPTTTASLRVHRWSSPLVRGHVNDFSVNGAVRTRPSDLGLQEEAPGARHRDEHADRQLAGRRRGAGRPASRRGRSCSRSRRARRRACGSSRAIRCGRRSRARARRTTA